MKTKVKKRKVNTQLDYCGICGLPRGVGAHNISPLMAVEQSCPNCNSKPAAICAVGIGHFIYACRKCSKRWDNLKEITYPEVKNENLS